MMMMDVLGIFNDAEMRNRAARRIFKDKPLLLIGSPMCTVFSSMNVINHSKMSPEEVKARYAYARQHLKFSTQFYKMQIEVGRYFLHEHSHSATAWQEDCIRKILGEQGVAKVPTNACTDSNPATRMARAQRGKGQDS